MGTVHTRVKVVNHSKSNITNTSISDTDPFDWASDRAGPDFNGVYISVGDSADRRAEIKRVATRCGFAMTLTFSNGSKDVFRIDQKHVDGHCPNFEHISGSHEITYGTDRSGHPTLVITVKPSPEELINEQAEERNREGEEALRRKEYEAAMAKFDEALRLANQDSTKNAIIYNRSEAQRKLQQKLEVQRWNQRGEEALSRGQFETAIENFDKALQIMPESWMVKSNKSDACYQYGKSLLQEIQDLEEDSTQDLSEEVLRKLTKAKALIQQAEALRHTANQKDVLDLINAKIEKHQLNEKVKALNKQGEDALRDKQYELATRIFDNALKLTTKGAMITIISNNKEIATQKQQKKERAQQLNSEGEEALQLKKYEIAIKKFDEALEQVNGSWLIKSNKADGCAQYGQSLMKQALQLEADETQDKSEEAQEKFRKARAMLQQAEALRHTAEQEGNLKLVNLKIGGNQLFNEGHERELEGSKLFEQSHDYSGAKKKYQDALRKYEEAKKKFEEGSMFDYAKFDESAKFASDRMENVLKTISEIDQAQLSDHISKVNFNTRDQKKIEVTETTTTAVLGR